MTIRKLPLTLLLAALGCVERGDVLTSVAATSGDQETGVDSDLDETDPQDAPTEGELTDAETAPGTDRPEPVVAEPNGVFEVSAGTSHSCGIADGSLYCWGENSSGQLGLGDAEQRIAPSRIGDATDWRAVAAAQVHSCAMNDAGAVFCWGGNERGQLGQGDRQSRSNPVKVDLPESATLLSADHSHTCVLLTTGALYCWGENFEGQLGQDDDYPAQDNTAADGLRPLRVGEEAWTDVDTGQGHTCGVRSDGSLWCWGRNTGALLASTEREQIRYPVRIGEDLDWTHADAGQNHSCGLRGGALYCWGINTGLDDDAGAVFGTDSVAQSPSPVRIGDFADWTHVSANTFHGCGLRGGELWCWGRAIEGQLGLPGIEVRTQPERVGGGYVSVRAGRFHTCAVSDGGELRCAGENNTGRLGTGDTERRNEFSRVALTE